MTGDEKFKFWISNGPTLRPLQVLDLKFQSAAWVRLAYKPHRD